MKKVLILAGSPRKSGNSALLCGEFARGASEAGNDVELIYLRDKKIGYCQACYYCKTHDGECVTKDDMAEILDKMNEMGPGSPREPGNRLPTGAMVSRISFCGADFLSIW